MYWGCSNSFSFDIAVIGFGNSTHRFFSMESMLCLVKIILVSIPGILMKDAVIQNVMMIGSFFKIIISLVLRFDNLFVKVFGEAC